MKKKHPLTKKHPSRFPIILIVIGLTLISIWGIHQYFYTRSLSLSDALLASFAEEKLTGALPIHIAIGDRIRLPVVESGKQDGVWAISQTSANHVRNSAVPGEMNNIIFYAHNTAPLFGPLDKVNVGDPIAIRMTDGSLHRYTVVSTAWVTTGHTELLSPTTHELLTLYTCGGLLDSLRIVVQALPDTRATPTSAPIR
jgi:LPXTG-site transpeptidase (sortase) family protein